jgi:hypothetical protein
MSYRAEIGLAALLTLALAIAAVAGRRQRVAPPSYDPRTSTYLDGPLGTKAVYDVLLALGRPVARRRAALFDLSAGSRRAPALVAVLDPPIDLQPAELDAVGAFLRRGGAVLAAGDGGGITRCAGWRASTARRYVLDSVALRAPAGLSLPPTAYYLEPDTAGTTVETRKRRLLAGAGPACGRLAATAADTLLTRGDGRLVALQLHYQGGGTLTLVSDAGFFRNRVWKASDVPRVALAWLTPPGRGPVIFDEYHQGFGGGESLARVVFLWLAGTPAGWTLLQLTAVGLLLLAIAAVRFGPALSVIERRRRSPLEHLEALGAGLESAAGSEVALQLLVAGLRRRLSRTGFVSDRRSDQYQWLRALELVLPTPRGRGAVRELQRIYHQPGGAERVLAAANAVEDVWEELRPQTTRAAS